SVCRSSSPPVAAARVLELHVAAVRKIQHAAIECRVHCVSCDVSSGVLSEVHKTRPPCNLQRAFLDRDWESDPPHRPPLCKREARFPGGLENYGSQIRHRFEASTQFPPLLKSFWRHLHPTCCCTSV